MRETADQSQPYEPTRAARVGELCLLVCGRHGASSVPFPAGAELVIGRSTSSQLVLVDPSVSRTHARISRREDGVWVEDLGSRHGTWLAGRRVTRAELAVGSSVRVGGVVIVLTRAGSRTPSEVRERAPSDALYLSQRMRDLHDLLQRAGRTELPVLVLGETGTGKELAAHELHVASPRQRGPLRVLNCAAIPPHLVESTLFGHERGAFTGAERARAGIFEEAHGGTLLLDEVGELSLAAQAALLRVLETHRFTRVGSARELSVDVRVIAATHRDLHTMAARGEFRVDLLHRLCVIAIELPPLRERREEIAALARHFLAQAGMERELAPEALACLEQYQWPGNLRELRNVLARAAALGTGPCLTEQDLPEAVRSRAEVPLWRQPPAPAAPATLRAHLKSAERAEVARALAQTGGNQRKAAELLGIPLRTFERRLRTLRQD